MQAIHHRSQAPSILSTLLPERGRGDAGNDVVYKEKSLKKSIWSKITQIRRKSYSNYVINGDDDDDVIMMTMIVTTTRQL